MSEWLAADLESLEASSGVNHVNEGFVRIRAQGQPESGSAAPVVLMGQVTPQQARVLALSFLQAAEAAEHDAAVVEVLRSIDTPDEAVAGFVADLCRRRRSATTGGGP